MYMTPTDDNLHTRLEMMSDLKAFLMSAPDQHTQDEIIQPYPLPNGETISCVQWKDSFFITGTDIVRCLVFRFEAFGRPITNIKKFEEGIFSDLRNLKPGTDAILEEPKSVFLELLFKNNCIRTQKKQKVFYWYSVPHDRLFLDALERDLKREKLSIEPTSQAISDPATHISLETTQAMYDEFRKAMLYELNLASESPASIDTSVFGQFSLFEGSPTYKQRKRRVTQQQTDIKKMKPYDFRHFECPLSSCAKVFKRLEHMKRHLRTHTLERPYLCDVCGKRFSRSDNLAQHKKTHNRNLPLSCHSSPAPVIKVEQYYDDLMVEELLPSPQQEINDDWQSKIDWNQYQDNVQGFLGYQPMITPIHTTVNSPIMEEEVYLSYCDDTPTMSPTDALLQL